MLRNVSILILVLAFTACSNSGGGNSNPGNRNIADAGTVLSSGQYQQGGQSWSYRNLRLINKQGGYAYAQFFKSTSPGKRPVIVLTKPYAGISWTGEALDNRWAGEYSNFLAGGNTGRMCVSDVDGPGYDVTNTSVICYYQESVTHAGDDAYLFLLNNFSVLLTYGRFYAGGSVANDVEDILAGLRYLGTRDDVDTTRIGITGGSWGGFEALYGALEAPASVRPAVAAPAFPVTDFSLLEDFVRNDLPMLVSAPVLDYYMNFYDPYLRRLHASTGKPPSYTGYTFADLDPLVDIPMLIPHDDADTILPAQFSHQFQAGHKDLISGFWYTRSDTVPWQTVPVSHGDIDGAVVFQPYLTFTTTFMMLRLADTTQNVLIAFGEQDMQTFFDNIYTYQVQARDLSWLVPRLIDLTDSRIYMVDISPSGNLTPIRGAQRVADWLNIRWGSSLTETDVQQFLINNGLPP